MSYNTSAIVITWNEECIIEKCLNYLIGVEQVGEIIVVDNFSTDRTPQIVQEFVGRTSKEVKLIQKVWEGQDAQWNTGIDNCKYPWVFWLAADETFSHELNHVLLWLGEQPKLIGVRIPTLVTYPDDKHYILGCIEENHTRIFRRGEGRFYGKSLEDLLDKNGQSLLWTGTPKILNCGSMPGGGALFKSTFRHHHQLLKTRDSMISKGIRWEGLGLFPEAAQKGMPIHRNTWVDLYDQANTRNYAPIPEEWM